MRLWDYRLLKVLPDKMIVSQWRECIAIKRQWEKGTLKHRLVSYVMDYDKGYFLQYVIDVVNELENRKIKYQEKYLNEIADFCYQLGRPASWFDYPEHNDRYLKQCFYNLQEKYDRGIITKEEWQKIEDLIGGEIE
jgi:uncharacterized protein (TIGR02328 family)